MENVVIKVIVQIALQLGAKWRTPFFSVVTSSLSNLIWRVSLSSEAWPYLEDDPAQGSLQMLCDSALKFRSFLHPI